jgi:hypothetical protein
MVSSTDDDNIHDLGSISPNLGKLSIDDDNDFLGLGGTSPSRGRPPQAYIMNVSWPIEAIPIASTKILSIFFLFLSLLP